MLTVEVLMLGMFSGAGRVVKLGSKLCFVAGTLVHTESGLVPIELIEEGDLVWARDVETGEEGWSPVLFTFVSKGKAVVELTFLGGGDTGSVLTVESTSEHPFWSLDRDGWVPASELAVGERVESLQGDLVVSSTQSDVERKTVFNIEVEGAHTYFVGSAGVWVHNICRGALLRALRQFNPRRFNFGNNKFLLDRRAMKHILERHHPSFWDGSTAARQTFFKSSQSVDELANIVSSVLKQNRAVLTREGRTQGMRQVRGTVDGVEYVVGLRNGRIGQLYAP